MTNANVILYNIIGQWETVFSLGIPPLKTSSGICVWSAQVPLLVLSSLGQFLTSQNRHSRHKNFAFLFTDKMRYLVSSLFFRRVLVSELVPPVLSTIIAIAVISARVSYNF